MILFYDKFVEMFVILRQDKERINVYDSFWLNQISLFGFYNENVEVLNYDGTHTNTPTLNTPSLLINNVDPAVNFNGVDQYVNLNNIFPILQSHVVGSISYLAKFPVGGNCAFHFGDASTNDLCEEGVCIHEKKAFNIIIALSSIFVVFFVGLGIWIFMHKDSIARVLATIMIFYSAIPSAFSSTMVS